MATLDSLAIRGIRSFDPQKMERIDFAKPGVTVIVGHNGSGKTTIVESLKYATTGEQPPNTKGGAFVHDPKMANEKEVKAQVKLRFYARNGLRMTTTRNLQVTRLNTGALRMKTLESLLDTDDPKGSKKRTTISTRCAEIDAEIPHLLGVSRAVLDNVIFCHQEDSHWPLSTAQILKTKFDEIFEATKYTKALENIKSIRKARATDQKTQQAILDGLASERKHAEKLNQKIADLDGTVDEKETQIEVLQEEATRITTENALFHDQATKFRDYYMRAEELEKRCKKDRAEVEVTEKDLGREKIPPSVSDEVLLQRISEFEANTQGKQEQVDGIRREVQEQKDKDTALQRKLRAVEATRIRLEGDATRHQENVEVRQATVTSLGDKHGIAGYDHAPVDEDSVLEFVHKLRTFQKRQTSTVDELQNALRAKNAEFVHKIAELRSQISTLSRDRDAAQSQVSQLQNSIAESEKFVDRNKALETEIKFNDDDLADKRTRLEKLRAEFRDARYEEKASSKAKDIQKLEVEREALNAEQSRLSLQADDRAKLDLKKADLKKKQGFIDRTLETHAAKFQTYFQVDAQPETMENDIEHLITVKTREQTRLENEYNKANRESAEVHGSCQRLIRELADKREEIKKMEKKLREAANLNNDQPEQISLDQAIADAATEMSHLQETAGNLVGAADFYKKLLTDGKKTKKCGVCERKLGPGKEMETFEQALMAKIDDTSAEKIQENKEEIASWTREHARLQEFLPMQADLVKATSDIPKMEKLAAEQKKKDEAAAAAAEKASTSLKEIKTCLTDLTMLREHARNVTRTNEEIAVVRGEISQIERNLQASGSMRTATEMQAELDNISQAMKNISREQKLVQTQKEQQDAAQRAVVDEIHAMEMKASQLQARLQEGRNAETKMDDDKKALADHRGRIPTMSTKMASLQGKVEELGSQQKEQERLLNDKLATAQDSLSALNASVLELENIQSRIEQYLAADSASQLNDATKQTADLESQIARVQSALEAKRSELAAAQKEIDQGGARLSNLKENERLRRLRREITETEAEIAALPMEEAAASKRTFTAKWEAMSRRENDIKAKVSRLLGEVSTMRAQVNTYKKDLSTDFKNIAKRYMDQLVKVKMSDMANNDLEKYAKALDNAIMKYHSLKMEEVNDTMRHLWNKTYQGTDIDGILIRSEGDGGPSKRSYNYRVVMMKDQVEMDMRGRCSAGQKMLASIIIRLALSDSFAQECGILALDEPTNALDVENIEALASSLVEIINERKRAANFQLIIITHDENFLRKLGENGVIQDYWRVTRSDSQKSVIEKHILS